MKLNKPTNPNYCFTVVKLGDDIKLPNMDNIVHKNVFGNLVITGKSIFKKGDLALYIPVETQLSSEYCKFNDLFDKKEFNNDTTKKGYISYKKRRIKAIKFYKGTYESNGLLMPLDSLSYINDDIAKSLTLGDEFDTIGGVAVCNKYELPIKRQKGQSNNNKPTGFNQVIDNQFKFHVDTLQLGKFIDRFNPHDLISITYKLHGTSAISSNVLVKRKLNLIEKLLLKLNVNINTSYYSNTGLYSSRKVIKNKWIRKENQYHQKADLRRTAHELISPLLPKGMTAYYELVGYEPNGTMIQKPFDYGYTNPNDDDNEYTEGVHFGIYVYRLTYTNESGIVFEFSAKQVQDWCKVFNVKPVPELYYGSANELFGYNDVDLHDWRQKLLIVLKDKYWLTQCNMCNNKVPSEGIVVRREGYSLDILKYKNFDFLLLETKSLDKS